MNHSELNTALQCMFQELISDGYRKADITNATIAASYRQKEITEFINGEKKFGLKPLIHIFDHLDIELHLVPVLKKDVEGKGQINEITTDTLEALKFFLIDYLENRKKNKKGMNDFMVNKINELNNGDER